MNMQKWIKDQRTAGVKKAMPILSFPAITLMDISVKKLVADSALMAKGMKVIADRCPTAASVSMMDLSVEAEAFGCEINIPDDEVPTVVGRLLKTEADIDNLKVPALTSGRTGLYLNAVRQAMDLIKDRPVFAGGIGPFTLSGRMMEMSELMVNCFEEPEMAHKTLRKATEFIKSYMLEYKKTGANGVVMAEPAAGLLSPEICEEFSSRYVREIRDAVRDDNFLFFYHNCGNTIPLKDTLMSIKADGYHFGNVIDIEAMLKIVPSDVFVMGNVDPAGVLRMGTPEQVRETALGLLKRCGKYPNYSVSSGCDIPPLTPWANLDAFFAAIRDHYGV